MLRARRSRILRYCHFIIGWGKRGTFLDGKESLMEDKTVGELLLDLDLSDEEIERHAHLILECLEREKKLLDHRQKIEEGIKIIEAHLNNIARTVYIIHKSLQRVNERMAEAILHYLPESNLPRA
jgi:hypothetical protein